MADKNLDEYQSKRFYSTNTKARQNGFAKFEKDGAYYFALYQGGDIVLISQAYKGIAGRDNGIESVKKNRRVAKRYRLDKRAGKKHGFGLFAGNGQEIAISPNYASKAAAERVAGRLNGSVKAPAKKATSVKAKAEPQKRVVKKTTPKKATAASVGRRGDYKPLKFYQARNGGVKEGFSGFSEGDAHYFTYSDKGKIVLISESYTSKAGRDNGIASVGKNKPIKERYAHRKHKNGKHYFDLKAGNSQEIATSIWYGSAAAALTGAAVLRGEKAKSKTKAKPKAKPQAKKAASAKTRKTNDEDNYRPLAFYNKHTKGRKNGIEKFKGNDGLYYFAVFENGKIRLISEGYPTTTAQDTGAASVTKNIKLEKRYDYRGPFKNGKYDYRLKAGNGKEIARSIWYGSAAAAATGAAYLMGTRKRAAPKRKKKISPIVAAAPLAVATSAVPAMATKAEPVKAAPVVPAKAAAPVAAAAPAATGGGFGWGWLKWFLPLLLLLALAFFGLKSCNENKVKLEAEAAVAAKIAANKAAAEKAAMLKAETEAKAKATAAAAAAAAASAAEAVAQTPEPEPEPAPQPIAEPEVATPTSAAYTSRACGPSEIGIFNVPNTAPVSLSYLGSNPEFGDSHGLSPRQFYEKLNARYSASAYDAGYLDHVFRQIGYPGGFKDADASVFSNETLPQGAKGLLGFGQQHAYQYSKLDVTNSRDLESFRIQSRNGRDINFMKTCGNYMYTCN